MIQWPGLEELKQNLDVTSGDWDGEEYDGDVTRLSRALAAAITRVKRDVGNWDEYVDLPDEALSQAALRAAVVMRANADYSGKTLEFDPIYQGYLKGHRRRFGIS